MCETAKRLGVPLPVSIQVCREDTLCRADTRSGTTCQRIKAGLARSGALWAGGPHTDLLWLPSACLHAPRKRPHSQAD